MNTSGEPKVSNSVNARPSGKPLQFRLRQTPVRLKCLFIRFRSIFPATLIYLFPIYVYINSIRQYNYFFIRYWYLFVLATASLVYSHAAWVHSKGKGIPQHIRLRKFYFSYFLFILLILLPEMPLVNILDLGTNSLGLSRNVFACFLLFLFSFIGYILLISNNDISEISFGNTKLAVIKEKVEKEIDKQVNLNESLIQKIRAEHIIIQNLGEYCDQIKERIDESGVFNIEDEFRNILSEYIALQDEAYSIGMLTDINEQIKEDYRLKKSEYNDLVSKIRTSELFEIHKDSYYMFFPYNFGDTRLCIVLESKIPIIKEERYLVLNILKELEEQLLVMLYIENLEENMYNNV